MCISARLKQVLVHKQMTATELAEMTGLSYRSVMNYLNEGRDPNVEALIKIHNGLQVSLTWLVTGKGEMFQHQLQESKMSAQEQALLTNYRSMSENLKDAFSVLFKGVAKK
ncbi:helix-turn-helix domain-containing protein [Pasteurella multocida]